MAFTPSVNYFSSCRTQSYAWNFGDGATSVDRKPVHAYANAGTYDVSLHIHYSCGVCYGDTTIHQAVVYDPSGNLVADSLIQVMTDVKSRV
jgi:hypothetical protein